VLSWVINDFLRYLKQTEPRGFKVVVMPDFFIDRFVTFSGDVTEFSKVISEVAERKGGNIHGVKQMELRGGNAANTAAALASLDVKVLPIITTDSMGLQLLQFYFSQLRVDLSHVKVSGQVGLTTALELAYGKEKVNIMLGNVGSLHGFGPDDLTEQDLEVIADADYVCVFNWASTHSHGAELAQTVFEHVKESGKGKTYYDTGDPSPNRGAIPALLKKVLKRDLVDVFSVNENEAFQYASRVDGKIKRMKSLNDPEAPKVCARALARHIFCRVDLHTSALSGSFTRDHEVVVPAFPVTPLRSTGAGDSWNAGNMYGDAHSFPDSCRLTMANAVAAYYISSPFAKHPALTELVEFGEKAAEQ
jgi:sugar/nucleoside kinase (ribokinase family)